MKNFSAIALGPRRRSVDVGGLALVLSKTGSGAGFIGDDESTDDGTPLFAELLSDMVTHTRAEVSEHMVGQHSIDISPETRQQLIYSLDSWNFEPHKLPDEVGLAAALILFESLFHIEGMEDDVGCNLEQVRPFLANLRQIYRTQNSYHNFHHALDVLQATHVFLSSAGLVPQASFLQHSEDQKWKSDRPKTGALSECLSNTDLFALYIAAIGHDVGHPGLTNLFMKNAQTPLSVVYNNTSALEQMHCALLLEVMRSHGISSILSRPGVGPFFRELLSKTVLATDMSIHFQFMADLKALVEGADIPLSKRKVLLCQALMKCSDISNPSRPLGVSRYWANALMVEWTNQAALERHLHLPATVQPSDTPLREAKSQVFFITTFAKPLFDLTSRAIPDVGRYAKQCNSNLTSWQETEARLVKEEALNALPPPLPRAVNTSIANAMPLTAELPGDFLSAFPLTLPTTLAPLGQLSPPSPTSQTPTSTTFFSSGPSSAPTSPPHSRTPSPTMPGAFIHSPPRPSSLHLYGDPHAMSQRSVSPPATLRSPVENTFAAHVRTLSGASGFSSASSRTSTKSTDATAIRDALKAGVRKKKSWHRSSWNPGGSSGTPREAVPDLPISPTSMLFPRHGTLAGAAATGTLVNGRQQMAG